MGNPGNPTEQMPHGDDYLVRRLDNLQRQINELGPSIANSFNTVVAQLVTPITANSQNAGFALPVGYANRVQVNPFAIPIPNGDYLQAIVIATSSDHAVNSTAGLDFLSSNIDIYLDGVFFTSLSSPSSTVPAGYEAASTVTLSTSVFPIAGAETITVASSPYTQNKAWAANPSNFTQLSAALFFLRN